MRKAPLIVFVLLFFSLLSIGLVKAAPPFEPILSDDELEIKYPEFSTLSVGQDFEFEIHVFNATTGVPITSGIICYFHLYNDTGKHQLELQDSTVSHMFDYSFDVDGGNFSQVGDYAYIVQCNNTASGGFASVPLQVSQIGGGLVNSDTVLVWCLIALAGMFIIMAFMFDVKQWIIKTSLWIFAMFSMLLAVSAARTIAGSSNNLIVYGDNAFYLILVGILFMLLYIFIYVTIMLFKSLRKNGVTL